MNLNIVNIVGFQTDIPNWSKVPADFKNLRHFNWGTTCCLGQCFTHHWEFGQRQRAFLRKGFPSISECPLSSSCAIWKSLPLNVHDIESRCSHCVIWSHCVVLRGAVAGRASSFFTQSTLKQTGALWQLFFSKKNQILQNSHFDFKKGYLDNNYGQTWFFDGKQLLDQ